VATVVRVVTLPRRAVAVIIVLILVFTIAPFRPEACRTGAKWREGARCCYHPGMAWRMLVLAVLVFASGFTLRVAWESFDEKGNDGPLR
jgi:hypothetical protein